MDTGLLFQIMGADGKGLLFYFFLFTLLQSECFLAAGVPKSTRYACCAGCGSFVNDAACCKDGIIFLRALGETCCSMKDAHKGCPCDIWEAIKKGITTIQMQEYEGLNSSSEVAFWKKCFDFL